MGIYRVPPQSGYLKKFVLPILFYLSFPFFLLFIFFISFSGAPLAPGPWTLSTHATQSLCHCASLKHTTHWPRIVAILPWQQSPMLSGLFRSALCVIDPSQQTIATGSCVLFVKGISAWIIVCTVCCIRTHYTGVGRNLGGTWNYFSGKTEMHAIFFSVSFLLWHGRGSNWGYWGFPAIKITVIRPVCMYCGLSVKIDTREMPNSAQRSQTHAFCLRFFPHVW